MAHRPQNRPFLEELLGEQVGVGELVPVGLRESDRQQLALVVPLVDGFAGGEPLVALQPDQRGVEDQRERLGSGGLADSRLALQQQRLAEREGKVQRRGHAIVDEVTHPVEPRPHVGGVPEAGHGIPPSTPRGGAGGV